MFRKGIVEDLVHSKYVELTPLATDFVETYSVRLRYSVRRGIGCRDNFLYWLLDRIL